jgi:hypothetical protein
MNTINTSERNRDQSSDIIFECLQSAVFIAKMDRIETVNELTAKLVSRGYAESDAAAAIKLWARLAA